MPKQHSGRPSLADELNFFLFKRQIFLFFFFSIQAVLKYHYLREVEGRE